MCQVIRRAEHEVKVDVFLLVNMIDCWMSVFQRIVFTWQQYGALRIGGSAYLTVGYGDIGFIHEEASLRRCQHVPVPIGDGVVQLVRHIVDDHLLAFLQRHAGRRIVGIEVLLHRHQLHLAVRGSGDGQRDVNHLAIGIGGTGIGRDILVIDIYRALDVPIVGGHPGSASLVSCTDVVAVVDDGLRAMYEVTRRLELLE